VDELTNLNLVVDDLVNLNLGQLVGRALYGELPRKPQPALVDAAEAARREAEQLLAVERERAARDEAARREQERSLDRARAAKIREEAEAARAAAEERARAAGVAARKRKTTKAPPAPHRIGTSSAIRALLAKHPEGLRSGEVAAALGIKVGLASAHLCTLSGVVKSGVRRRFVYRLKQG
jgi:membrane protein involved in colicin uptake